MRKLETSVVVCLLVLLGALATACGGGGGPGDPEPPPADDTLFSGPFGYASLRAQTGTPASVRAAWGTMTPAGDGTVTGTVRTNTNGGLGGPGILLPGSGYAVNAGRGFEWRPAGALAGIGRISTFGTYATFATDQSGTTPEMGLFVKRTGAFTLGSLNATYHVCTFDHNAGGPADRSLRGNGTFLGNGNGSYVLNQNVDGATTLFGNATWTYAVTGTGVVTINFGAEVWEGQILLGGDLVVLAGSSAASGRPHLVIMIRQSQNATNALFNGNYFVSGIESNGAASYTSVSGAVYTTGGAGATLNATRNQDGNVGAPTVFPTGFGVTATGLFSMPTGTRQMSGGIAPSGDFAVLGGPTGTTQRPALYFLMR